MKHFWYYLSIVFLVFSCNSDSKKVKVVDFISESADVVLTINNLEGFTNNLNNNDLLSSLNKTKSYQNTVAQFAFIKNLKTKHPIYIGINSEKETVFSFTTRLSDSIFTLDSTKRKSLQLKGFSAEEILIDSLKLYVTKKDSLLIGSNTKTELEQIINSKQKPEHIKNLYYLAGFPFTIFLDDISFKTFEPKPTVTLLEIVKFRPIVAPHPINT